MDCIYSEIFNIFSINSSHFLSLSKASDSRRLSLLLSSRTYQSPATHYLHYSTFKRLLMESATFIQNSFGFSCQASNIGSRFETPIRNGPNSLHFGSKLSILHSVGRSKKTNSLPPLSLSQRNVGFGRRRFGIIRASSSSDSVARAGGGVAPLQLESPVGQFLSEILISHPHLVPAAVEQQLEQLQTDRDAQKKEDNPSSGNDIVLYRRIAEVKANERKKALEEILYAMVVQRFMESDVSLVPSITTTPLSPDQSRVDSWPAQDEKLEKLHSLEANEMIQNHLALILGNRLGDLSLVAQISRLRVGQVYAASVMYGYFLKRVDQRFQLEKSMKILLQGSANEVVGLKQSLDKTRRTIGEDSFKTENSSGSGEKIKSSRLRNYVMSFDGDTLQGYATIRSKEAVTIIEKHTEALFGRGKIVITPKGTIDSSSDEHLKISLGGLRRLILEAVTFGSFLWDVESYVDSRYYFVTS